MGWKWGVYLGARDLEDAFGRVVGDGKPVAPPAHHASVQKPHLRVVPTSKHAAHANT